MISDILNLVFPARCPVCGEVLGDGAQIICTRCLYDMPLTHFESRTDNPIVERFWGLVPVVNACSMFWFTQQGGYRQLIHTIKYRGGWRYAERLGFLFGTRIDEGGLYGDVDVVIAVPLHFRRLLSRGYNQSEYIARGVAEALGTSVDIRSVVRKRYNTRQANIKHEKRWDNVADIFAVRRPERLAGKHILLVDDVLTTGATILSCAESIIAAVPDCRISIATLAVSKHEFTKKRG